MTDLNTLWLIDWLICSHWLGCCCWWCWICCFGWFFFSEHAPVFIVASVCPQWLLSYPREREDFHILLNRQETYWTMVKPADPPRMRQMYARATSSQLLFHKTCQKTWKTIIFSAIGTRPDTMQSQIHLGLNWNWVEIAIWEIGQSGRAAEDNQIYKI